MKTSKATRPNERPIAETLRIWGADIGRWPEAAPKAEARRALLADPDIRRAHEAEKSLDAALRRHRAGLDRSIAGEGGLARVKAGALSRIRRRPAFGLGRVAAAVLVAGLLGGAVDVLFLPPPQETQVVVADALVYGPETVEFQ